MDAHRRNRDEHHRYIGENDSGPSDEHDPDLGSLDDPDQSSLVVIVGQLSRQRGEEEEGEDEERLGDGAELELLMGVRIELVSDEQDDRLLEQAVIEGAEKLRRKQRNEPPRAQQVCNILDQAETAAGFMELGATA